MSQVWTGSGITCLSNDCLGAHPYHGQRRCSETENGKRCECQVSL